MWASVHRLWVVIPKWFKRQKRPHIYAWDENSRHMHEEKVVKDVSYYARQCGYDIRDEDVETQDGYFLRSAMLSLSSRLSLTFIPVCIV
jgi:hypothetical protein